MEVTGALVELMVTDVQASADFYERVLDFSLVAEESENGQKYRALYGTCLSPDKVEWLQNFIQRNR